MKQDRRTALRRYLPIIIGTIAGALGGYLYYRSAGCAGGSCMIASDPYISAIYGGTIGALLGFVLAPDSGCACAAVRQEEEHHE